MFSTTFIIAALAAASSVLADGPSSLLAEVDVAFRNKITGTESSIQVQVPYTGGCAPLSRDTNNLQVTMLDVGKNADCHLASDINCSGAIDGPSGNGQRWENLAIDAAAVSCFYVSDPRVAAPTYAAPPS